MAWALTSPSGLGVVGHVISYAFALLLSLPAAVVGVRVLLRVRRFGRSRFELETLPGSIGGDLAGTLVANGRLFEVPELVATLRCDRIERRGGGKSRSEVTVNQWRAERTLKGPFALVADHTRVPLRFAIPLEARATDERDFQNVIRWRLSVKGPVGRARYDAEFEVPVFDLGAQGHAADAEAHARAAKEAALAASVRWALGEGPRPRDLGDAQSAWSWLSWLLVPLGLPAVACAWLASGRAVATTAQELFWGGIVASAVVAGWYVGGAYSKLVDDLAGRGALPRALVGFIFFALLAGVLAAGVALGLEVR
jgi:hypothetical protein